MKPKSRQQPKNPPDITVLERRISTLERDFKKILFTLKQIDKKVTNNENNIRHNTAER